MTALQSEPARVQQLPLWRQLQALTQVLHAVNQGRSLSAVLAAVPPQLRPGVQALSFEALRCWGRARALRDLLVKRPSKGLSDALLCAALALLQRQSHASYDPFTLVDQAVESAKRTPALKHQASFVNACLRRFLRQRELLLAQTEVDPVARWNHPLWWLEQLQLDWPAQWRQIAAAASQMAPMVLRVNARLGTPAQYLQQLELAGIKAQAVGPFGVVLDRPCALTQLPGFAQGLISVQDSAAQLAAPLLLAHLPVASHLRVLDACAAPGGKTAHLLELSDAEVTALDIGPSRCQLIEQNLSRLGLSARVLAADAGAVASWWDGQAFDAILLDAPCSASGIVRRHPDIVWLRRLSDITQLAALQARLLDQLWPLLKTGGCLLYCTCSVFQQEGQQQLNSFLKRHNQARMLAAPGHLLPAGAPYGATASDNRIANYDGFYYALVKKQAA